MKTVFWAFILFLPVLCLAQNSIEVGHAQIVYSKPNDSLWVLDKFESPTKKSRATIMFKHIPILDSLNRPVQPAIGIHYEEVTEKMDCIEYALNFIGLYPFHKPMPVLGYPKYSSNKNSLVYLGEYTRYEVNHKVIIAYILDKHVGIEIIMDATSELYPKVESDMLLFLKNIIIK